MEKLISKIKLIFQKIKFLLLYIIKQLRIFIQKTIPLLNKILKLINRLIEKLLGRLGLLKISGENVTSNVTKLVIDKPNRLINRQKKLTWFVFWLISVYFVGLVGLGQAVYLARIDSPIIRGFLTIYPLPAAIVDLDFVPVKTYLRQIEFSQNYSSATGQIVGTDEEISKQVLDRMIEDSIVQSHSKLLSINMSSATVDEKYNTITSENGGPGEVEKVLKNLYGMSPEEFKQLIKVQLIKDEIMKNKIEQVKIKHILVADENKAKELIEKLTAGEDFAKLAKEFSKDEKSRDAGGELDFVPRGGLVKELDDVVFNLQPGILNPTPVKTEHGYHIVYLIEKKGEIKAAGFSDWIEQEKKQAFLVRFIK